MTECRACPRGYIASKPGRAQCDLCPPRETTTREGAVACICEAGAYRILDKEIDPQQQGRGLSSRANAASRDKNISTTCLSCPEGISCKTAGSHLADLVLDPGMWRAGPDDRDFLRCPVAEACVGGNGRRSSNTTGTTNTTSSSPDSSGYCLTGHHGPLCAICDSGYSRWSNTVLCSKCPENMAPSILATIGAAIGLGLLLFICLFFNRRAPNGVLRPLINAAQNLVVVMMFPVEWPDSIKGLSRALSGINLELVQIASPACLGMPVSYYGRLASMVVITTVIIGLPWLVSWLQHRRDAAKWAAAVKNRLRDTFLLVVLLHPTISGTAFYHFRCRAVNYADQRAQGSSGYEAKQYLMADYSLECYDSAWSGMLALALIVILGFSLGMPILFARLLWKRRAELQNPETKKLLGVLYMSYKPDLYWFESVTMTFKLALWATLVFFDHGSQFQLAMSAAICFLQLGVHARFEPFETRFKNTMQYVSFTLVAFAAFSGLLLNYINLATELATARFKLDEFERLRSKQEIFKICTAVVIWAGTVAIIIQMVYYTFKFCRRHGAAVRRLGSRAKGVVTRLASRVSSSQASSHTSSRERSKNGDNVELSMVESKRRPDSARCEPEAIAPVAQEAAVSSDWKPNPVGHLSPRELSTT